MCVRFPLAAKVWKSGKYDEELGVDRRKEEYYKPDAPTDLGYGSGGGAAG